MAHQIYINDLTVRFPKTTKNAAFSRRRVISSSPWEFVSLWLRQNANSNSQIYWQQAREFWNSSKELSVSAAPLPLYYSFMNAAKALLEAKGQNYVPYHGASGFDLRSRGGAVRLGNEGVKLKEGGIIPSVSKYFDEAEIVRKYSLAEVLSNLPFVHRAFSICFARAEIFLSISRPRYMTDDSGQAWFRADLPSEHNHPSTLRTLPSTLVHRRLSGNDVIESAIKFPWSGSRKPSDADISELQMFHQSIRRDIKFISGPRSYWYVKRRLRAYKAIDRNGITLILMAMHRMSEIARYKPVELTSLLDSSQNWLIYEFVKVAQNQFIDEIAAEITGLEIAPAGVRQSAFD